MNLLIKQVHVIDPQNKVDGVFDVLIKKRLVAELKKEVNSDGVEVLDGNGKYLFPGLVDMHVHFREPGYEQKETILSGSKAALAGGFVAVVTMPNTDPPCDHQSVIDNIIRKANEVPFYIFPCGTLTKERAGKELSEMADLKRAGAWAVSDDGAWVSDSLLMRRAMEYASMLGLLVMTHAEDKRLASGGVMNEGIMSTRLGLKGIPNASEAVAVSRDILLAQLTGAPLHLTHISTKESVDLIRLAKADQLPVTADVTPHHLALTDEALEHYDTNFKMMPPLRTEADRQAVLEGLGDGTIDAIATDHAPHTEEEKMAEFPEAPVGVVGVETALGVALTHLYHTKVLSLKDVVIKMSTRPAEILKLPKQFGQIKVGAEANLTLVDVNQEWIVKKEEFVSKSKNSCFIGMKLKGKAVATICRGQLWQKQS
ncbi:MAG: dihydroorotase [Candidatus Omnitrophica bacterium]|nr:dihydroorotase [Candidatus Omnitrophota bacterium]